MANPRTKTHPGLLAVLAPGDSVTVSNEEGRRWTGTIDLVAPGLGVIWVHTHEGERKVFDVHDYKIQDFTDQ